MSGGTIGSGTFGGGTIGAPEPDTGPSVPFGARIIFIDQRDRIVVLEPLSNFEVAPERLIVTAPGPQGPRGPAGPSGGQYLEYIRTVAAATWIISHNFGRRTSVTLFDSSGAVVYADIEENEPWLVTTVTYPSPFAGSALVL